MNWCGEAGEMLNDLDATVDQCTLRNGDCLLVMPGKVPPKVSTSVGVSADPKPIIFSTLHVDI